MQLPSYWVTNTNDRPSLQNIAISEGMQRRGTYSGALPKRFPATSFGLINMALQIRRVRGNRAHGLKPWPITAAYRT
jgi:hypothetical protein